MADKKTTAQPKVAEFHWQLSSLTKWKIRYKHLSSEFDFHAIQLLGLKIVSLHVAWNCVSCYFFWNHSPPFLQNVSKMFHKKINNLNHIKSFFRSKIKYTAFLSGSSWVNDLTEVNEMYYRYLRQMIMLSKIVTNLIRLYNLSSVAIDWDSRDFQYRWRFKIIWFKRISLLQ